MFSHFAAWWSSLHWPAATAIGFMAFSVCICAWVASINWLRANLGGNRRAIPPRRHNDLPMENHRSERKAVKKPPPWHVVDYSAQYREKAAWLGDDGLLAKPMRRIRQGSYEVGKVVQFERKPK